MCLCLLNSDELCLFVMLPSVASNDTVPCVVFVKDEFRLSVDVLFFFIGRRGKISLLPSDCVSVFIHVFLRNRVRPCCYVLIASQQCLL